MNKELSPSLADRIEAHKARTGLIHELVDQISQGILWQGNRSNDLEEWVEVATDAIKKELTASSNETLKDEAFNLGLYDYHNEEASPPLQKFLDVLGYKLMKCGRCDWEDFVAPVLINEWARVDGSGARFERKWTDCPECGAIAKPIDN